MSSGDQIGVGGRLRRAQPIGAMPLLAGSFQVLLATILWSSSAILVDQLGSVYRQTALQISAGRVLLVVPMLIAFVVLWRPLSLRVDAADLPLYAASGVAVSLSYVTWSASVQINRAAVAAALSFSFPAFVAFGDRLLFGTRLNRLQIGAIAVNLLGCALAARIHGPVDLVRNPGGLLVGLSNGLAFTAYTLLGRGTARTGRRDALTALLYMFIFATLGLVAAGLVEQGDALFRPQLDLKGWALLGGLALGPTLVAYALFNRSLTDLPATVASLVTTLEPVLVALLAYVVLGRSVEPSQLAGIALIVSAVAVMQRQMMLSAQSSGKQSSSESDAGA